MLLQLFTAAALHPRRLSSICGTKNSSTWNILKSHWFR